jgi:hypothetical protein
VSNVSESTLRLLDILTMAKQGSKGDELFHMTTTDRIEWFTKGKIGLTKVQCGVQTKRAYNFQEASKKGAYCAVQDVDHRLLRRLWTHQYSNGGTLDFDEIKGNWVALSALVHSRHQVNNPDLIGMDIKHEDQLSTNLNTLQIFLYKDVLPAWDAVQKQTTTVSMMIVLLLFLQKQNRRHLPHGHLTGQRSARVPAEHRREQPGCQHAAVRVLQAHEVGARTRDLHAGPAVQHRPKRELRA